MHPAVEILIQEESKSIERLEELSADYSIEIENHKERIRSLKSLWLHFREDILINKMVKIADKKIKHYHVDFFYWDLSLLKEYEGRFAWFVGEYGTNLIKLDNESEEENNKQKSWLHAVKTHRKGYELYEGDMNNKTLNRVSVENLSFKIIKKKTA